MSQVSRSAVKSILRKTAQEARTVAVVVRSQSRAAGREVGNTASSSEERNTSRLVTVLRHTVTTYRVDVASYLTQKSGYSMAAAARTPL